MPRATLLPLCLLVAMQAAPGCRKPDSILLIEVSTSMAINPVQLAVTITAGLDSRRLMIPPVAGGPLRLPTSFTVELDRSRGGPLTVSIDALDDLESIVACGTTVQRHLQVGGQTVVPVCLDACGDPGTDFDAGQTEQDAGSAGAGADARLDGGGN